MLDATVDPSGSMIVGAGGDGVLRFWDMTSGALIWALPAHRTLIAGIHFEGLDVVTRSFTGELARVHLTGEVSLPAVDRLVRCLPLRLDEDRGILVEQAPCGPTLSPQLGMATVACRTCKLAESAQDEAR